ncbi:MAG TPA: 23S rRNA (uridine(2552)-2'-O)-methyltransferase RlmE [Gammaproteobacteria bacterium]|nr:23S rRNA (uridine(2552)-2'-O)-methyltransferase RlmE [Gammaproteobacteria bacterium]
MPVSKSSRRWLREHFSDPYVKRAQQEGYRSRAVYKLLELQERDKLFKPGMTVIDLGAAPGSWSQVITKWVGKKGRVIALDILPMEPLLGVEFIKGDFADPTVLNELLQHLGDAKSDWVVSDMAPNLTGINSVDQPRSIELAELALDLANQVLHDEGSLLVKVFQGVGFDEFLIELRRHFKKVIIRKPKASRDRSNEVYLLARK